jgi:signal transduction histidine kinase
MKKNTKRSIYVRIFSAFLATYMVLMIGFSLIVVFMEKKTVEKEMILYSNNINSHVEDTLKEYVDSDNNIADISKVKKEFIKISNIFSEIGAEIAIFTDDYELILNTNNYWTVQYSISEGNTDKIVYGLLNPKEWYSEEEIRELQSYLSTKPNANKPGDFILDIDGLWIDNEMVIPDKISVEAYYAETFHEDGSVDQIRIVPLDGAVYTSGYTGSKDLLYIEHGNINPFYNSKPNNQSQDELRGMVTDESNLKNSIQQYFSPIKHIERVNLLTYRYYLVMPYQNLIHLKDNSVYSKFWTAIGIDVNIGERIAPMLVYVWISCLIIFSIAAYILSRQTFKTYLKQEELERQRKEMTDALAHDLKTPLGIISGYAQNLQEDVHTEKREHYASHIQSNVYRMDKIIKKMLEMSKLDSASFEINYENVSLKEINSGIINRYRNICDEKSITASITGETVIRADKALIERVIDNFFVNALDNMNDGGKIHISIKDDTFEIFNSGSHIPEDILEDIWLPYKKGNINRNNTKGSGLGLSIVRTILDLHKFTYGVKNKEDGVTFWFKFK